jgi:hypothetical protein
MGPPPNYGINASPNTGAMNVPNAGSNPGIIIPSSQPNPNLTMPDFSSNVNNLSGDQDQTTNKDGINPNELSLINEGYYPGMSQHEYDERQWEDNFN